MAVQKQPLDEKEVVVHVPKGTAGDVKVVEVDPKDASAEITVQISKKRKPGVMPVLGVIVK